MSPPLAVDVSASVEIEAPLLNSRRITERVIDPASPLLVDRAVICGPRSGNTISEAVILTSPPLPGPAVKVTHRIEVSGGDQLGLIARLSEIFAQFGANIVRLDAQKLPDAEGGRYVTRFAVSLPPDRAQTCLATIANTAGSLGLESSAEESAD